MPGPAIGSRQMQLPETKNRTVAGSTVRLAPFDEGDADEQYQSWLRDPDIAKFLVNARYEDLSLEGLRAYVRGRRNSPSSYFFKIVARETDMKIGTVSLNTDIHQAVGSYGYIMGERHYWGGSYAMEALVLLMDFGFDVLGLRRITGSAFANNVSSRFNFRRLGFTQEGVAREHVVGVGGEIIDSIRYGLLAREWRDRAPAFDKHREARS